MMWLLGGAYCLILWLVFDKWKLLRLSLPIAIVAASIGPALILSLLFCSQYYHPMSNDVRVFQKVAPILPQMQQPGRVTRIAVKPNVPIAEGEVLFEVDPIPYQKTVDQLTAVVNQVEQSVGIAEASIEIAQATIKRSESDLEFMTNERKRLKKLVASGAVTQEEYEKTLTSYQQASSTLKQAHLGHKQSVLSVESAKAKLSQSQASLDDAKYDLEQTIVHAPSDGYVTNLQLQKGMLVGGAGSSSVMSFVQDRKENERGIVIALVGQKNYLLIKPKQYAEVVLDGYPGRIFTGRVLTTIDVSGAGQLTASGDLPDELGPAKPTKFAVRIKLDDAEELRLPAGSNGLAAIYTENVPVAGIPVMFVVRMKSWLKFLF